MSNPIQSPPAYMQVLDSGGSNGNPGYGQLMMSSPSSAGPIPVGTIVPLDPVTSAIECGVKVDGLRKHRLELQLFRNEEIEVFIASNDPERRVLVRPSILAKYIGCTASRIGMYLHRKRNILPGIYQASSFLYKQAGTAGLKAGSYFVSLQVCSQISKHCSRKSIKKEEVDKNADDASNLHGEGIDLDAEIDLTEFSLNNITPNPRPPMMTSSLPMQYPQQVPASPRASPMSYPPSSGGYASHPTMSPLYSGHPQNVPLGSQYPSNVPPGNYPRDYQGISQYGYNGPYQGSPMQYSKVSMDPMGASPHGTPALSSPNGPMFYGHRFPSQPQQVQNQSLPYSAHYPYQTQNRAHHPEF